jgi:hypothetical protein
MVVHDGQVAVEVRHGKAVDHRAAAISGNFSAGAAASHV